MQEDTEDNKPHLCVPTCFESHDILTPMVIAPQTISASACGVSTLTLYMLLVPGSCQQDQELLFLHGLLVLTQALFLMVMVMLDE